jgi:phosphoglycolate phosphatase-like HAD superfamily hydrolase
MRRANDVSAARRLSRSTLFGVLLACVALPGLARAADALPGWNDGPVKARIVDFVRSVTDPASKSYVPPAERIAVFDNDGTLWSEQPMYFQLAFALDRVKAMAPSHPEWKTQEPFKSVLAGDVAGVAAAGEHGLVQMIAATHAGTTSEEFSGIVSNWLATARHPSLGKRYTELTYAPMKELLAHLRANGFKTYIVTGGGVEFVRAFSEQAYGVPPEQVVGSSIKTRYEVRDGKPGIVRLPEVDFIDDKAGKPVGINRYIGRRPILAFGNSDGDFEMLEYTTSGAGPRLGLLVHHDDGQREFAYDRKSSVGRLERGLDEAARRDWAIVSMKNDWRTVY